MDHDRHSLMVFQSDTSKSEPEIGTQPPPAYSGDEEQRTATPLLEGLYMLRNKKTRTVLDLRWCGETLECHAAWPKTNGAIAHQLWLIQKRSPNDACTIRNLQYAKYMEVESQSNSAFGPLGFFTKSRSKAVPRLQLAENNSRLNQQWWIEEVEHGEHTLKCAGTNTFLEIPGGDSPYGAKVTCSNAEGDKDGQIWILDRVSRTGSEIKALFESWKPDIAARVMQPHATQTEYFVLPHELRQQIWKDTELSRQPIRAGIFDYNDFVIKSKDAVGSWARDELPIPIQGPSILFGIIYGEARKGPKAYNWYLARDMRSLVFFDAQIGEEYGPAALDEFGFNPTFVTF